MCIYVTPFKVTIYKYYSTTRDSKNYIKLCDNLLILKIEIHAILNKNTKFKS